ncbi:hypothetical protein H072_1659 [Dactylellina haptotyla CBS 200.50]|uniref:Uncharacterized protein n=1 Tax=Dactylellina haptotyla (strain CBS 200.50) TaxID=1284197 RepID=S8AN54_DACHA|nr:hypothetical protein H072_1659 [Dactylellina haptotyla CBS 200.50]
MSSPNSLSNQDFAMLRRQSLENSKELETEEPGAIDPKGCLRNINSETIRDRESESPVSPRDGTFRPDEKDVQPSFKYLTAEYWEILRLLGQKWRKTVPMMFHCGEEDIPPIQLTTASNYLISGTKMKRSERKSKAWKGLKGLWEDPSGANKRMGEDYVKLTIDNNRNLQPHVSDLRFIGIYSIENEAASAAIKESFRRLNLDKRKDIMVVRRAADGIQRDVYDVLSVVPVFKGVTRMLAEHGNALGHRIVSQIQIKYSSRNMSQPRMYPNALLTLEELAASAGDEI